MDDNAYFTMLIPAALVNGALGGYAVGRNGTVPFASASERIGSLSAPEVSVANQPYFADGERYDISTDDDSYLGELDAENVDGEGRAVLEGKGIDIDWKE